jgi:beta-lactamase class A
MRSIQPLIVLASLAAICGCAAPKLIALPMPVGVATSPGLRLLEVEIRAIIATEAPHDSLEVAVALVDMATGDSLLIDSNTRMHAASTMKVPVMLELFRLAERGELSLDAPVEVRNSFVSIADGSTYSLTATDDSDAELYDMVGTALPMRELIRRMIVRSSNLATNILIELADPERIAETLSRVGASEMRVLRGVEDIPAYERGMNNTTTAYGLMKTLEAVAGDEVVSRESSAGMVRILAEQEFREMIPSGLPEGTRVANKTGWIPGISHDGAIIYPAAREPYVLVVLTRGFTDPEDAARAARRVSRRVWMELSVIPPE